MHGCTGIGTVHCTAVQGPWATPVWQQLIQHGLRCHYDPEALQLAQQGVQELQLSL
jgi:hypothetical protein